MTSASSRLRLLNLAFVVPTLIITGGVYAQSYTAGQIAKFLNTGSNVVTNSVITENASGFIGIGDTNPQTSLWINGETTVTGPGADVRFAPRSGSGITMSFYNPSGTDLRVSGATPDIATFASNGNVGIGDSNPLTRLWVNGETTVTGSSADVRFAPRSGSGTTMSFYNPSGTDLRLSGYSADLVTFLSTGNVGFGTNSPGAKLDVNGSARFFGQTVPSSGAGLEVDFVGASSTGEVRSYNRTTSSYGPLLLNDAVTVTGGATGRVGVGVPNPAYALDVNGTIHGTNVIATYQDVAEWVPASSEMTAGTVVVLNLEKSNEVMPSSTAYDTAVAGVVSAQPGIILGKPGEDKAQIATTGRVKVWVDASRAPIQIGDLLVSSDVRGTAMKSEAMEINGRRFHQPGTIIGKALEPLESGTGEILVLLSLQ